METANKTTKALAYNLECTGDVVAGDSILFEEAVFGGTYRKPTFLGSRRIAAEVLRESYGAKKQQHTFSLRVLWSEGKQALEAGAEIRRKGRNLYANGTLRKPWPDESAREARRDEKHTRGNKARKLRRERVQSFSGGESF